MHFHVGGGKGRERAKADSAMWIYLVGAVFFYLHHAPANYFIIIIFIFTSPAQHALSGYTWSQLLAYKSS